MTSDDEQFTFVFDEHHARLCRFLACMAGGQSVAQDLAQECFLRLYRSGAYKLPPDEVRYWLYTVARNLARNEARRRWVRERLVGRVTELFRGADTDVEVRHEQDERSAVLRDLLRSLPERQRTILLLREQEEMSYADIARVLGVSEDNVKVSIFRARRKLKKRFADATNRIEQVPDGRAESGC